MPGGDESVSAIVAFPTQHAHADIVARCDETPYGIGDFSSSVFHQLQAGDAVTVGGKPVDFAHFGGGKSFHGRSRRDHNIQPPLTLTTCPVTYSASSEAKKATVAATSSTVGGRPIGKRAS